MFDQDGNRFHGEAAKSKQNFYYENSKKNYRIKAERIEQTVVKYLESILRENGILEQALRQVCGSENMKLSELDREIAQKEKEIRQCERVLEVMDSQEPMHIAANPHLVGDILLEGMRVRKESEERIEQLTKNLALLYERKEEIEKFSKRDDICIKLKHALKVFKNSPSFRKKQLIQTMVPKLVVDEKKDELNFYINPLLDKSFKNNDLPLSLIQPISDYKTKNSCSPKKGVERESY